MTVAMRAYHTYLQTGPEKPFRTRHFWRTTMKDCPLVHPNHQAQALVIPLIALRCEVIEVNNKVKFSIYVLITEVGGTIIE